MRDHSTFKTAMFGICAAFIVLVIAVVLLTNMDSLGWGRGKQPSQTGGESLPPGQVGYDLEGFLYDETFFDEETTLPLVEVISGAPEEGTEGYTHVIPDAEETGESGEKESETSESETEAKGKMNAPAGDGNGPDGDKTSDKDRDSSREEPPGEPGDMGEKPGEPPEGPQKYGKEMGANGKD
ncbi:MAG: hypothetical protein K6E33_04505 [Lachnospiraceae bacterium]|nr:hypothetical protein [Lachnospiraceae bacterium]